MRWNRAGGAGQAIDERWLSHCGCCLWGSGLMMRLEGDSTKMFGDGAAEHEAKAALRESEARLRALNADRERRVIERTRARGRTWAVTPT